MLNEIESESKANCSSESNKGKDNSSIGLPPFLGLLSICSTFAILALSYHTICLLVKNVETLRRHTVLALTRLWRCTTKFFAWCYSKLQSRNASEENVTNSQQILVVVESLLIMYWLLMLHEQFMLHTTIVKMFVQYIIYYANTF